MVHVRTQYVNFAITKYTQEKAIKEPHHNIATFKYNVEQEHQTCCLWSRGQGEDFLWSQLFLPSHHNHQSSASPFSTFNEWGETLPHWNSLWRREREREKHLGPASFSHLLHKVVSQHRSHHPFSLSSTDSYPQESTREQSGQLHGIFLFPSDLNLSNFQVLW